VRHRAVAALTAFGEEAAPAVAALGAVVLNSRESEPTRQLAMKALIRTGPGPRKDVIATLEKASQEKNNFGVRSLAEQLLKQVQDVE
jgi:hypothetical protein